MLDRDDSWFLFILVYFIHWGAYMAIQGMIIFVYWRFLGYPHMYACFRMTLFTFNLLLYCSVTSVTYLSSYHWIDDVMSARLASWKSGLSSQPCCVAYWTYQGGKPFFNSAYVCVCSLYWCVFLYFVLCLPLLYIGLSRLLCSHVCIAEPAWCC